jgi:hypothetical protein
MVQYIQWFFFLPDFSMLSYSSYGVWSYLDPFYGQFVP